MTNVEVSIRLNVGFVPIADIPHSFDRGGANHKPLLEMLTVDSLQWIAPI